MSEAELPIAWVDAGGAVHGAAKDLQLALPPGGIVAIALVSACGDYLVCRQRSIIHYSTMAYSLRTGAAVWPIAESCYIVGAVDDVVWLNPWKTVLAQSEFKAVRVATGAVVDVVRLENVDTIRVISDGVQKGCLLSWHRYSPDMEKVTLYATGTHKVIWQIDHAMTVHHTRHLIARDDWICLESSGASRYTFIRQSDGTRICSLLPRCELWHPRMMPASILQNVRSIRMEPKEIAALPPRHNLQCMAVLLVSSGSIVTINGATGDLLSIRPAPGHVAAWHWSTADCARRECAQIDAAVAAIDELVDAAVDELVDAAVDAAVDAEADDVGLVRAVLVGFLAEDARLTALQ